MIEFDWEEQRAISEKENKLQVLVSDVRFLTRQTEQNIILIGQRLQEIKNIVGHGNFSDYIEENCGYSYQMANRFMKIAAEYTVESMPAGLGIGKLTELLSLPAAEREEFVATHDVEDLSVRQLRAEIARVKAERDQQAEQLRTTIDQAQHKVSESELRAMDWQRKAEGLDSTLDGILAVNERLRAQNEALKAQTESAEPSVDAVEQHSLYRSAVSARDRAERRAQELERDLDDALETKGDLAAEMAMLKVENARLKEAANAPAQPMPRMSTYVQAREELELLKARLFDLAPVIDEACGLDGNPAWGTWLDEVCGELAKVSGALAEATARIMQGLERAEHNE